MSFEIVVPPLGESVSEATVARWHKKAGDAINVDELVVELETDKVTLEVNAPTSGTLSEIVIQEGQNVGVGTILGRMVEGAVQARAVQQDIKVESNNQNQTAATTVANSNVIAAPSATKIASERGIDLAAIAGSGKDGRITKADVISTNTTTTTNLQVVSDNSLREKRVKMTRLRQTIAARLKESQNTAAILSTFNEVDMSEIFRIRKEYQDRFTETHGVKLGFMSFFVKAVVQALQEVPAVNAEIDGDELVYKNYYDVGIAVGTENGLVVPVLRNADKLNFGEIEKGIAGLGKKARDGKLTMADMAGATFSITNGGIYGSLLSTPIINPPQSGILGMHNIVERPVAVNGQVVVRPMMYIALSYDHRIIDGKEAVTFLVKIKQLCEKPEKLLFGI